MTLLFVHLWPAILLALGLGLAVGLLFGFGSGMLSARRASRLLALAIWIVLAAAVVFRLVPGRAGLWLDTAVLLSFAYGAGWLGGTWLKGTWLTGAKSRNVPPASPPPAETPGAGPAASLEGLNA